MEETLIIKEHNNFEDYQSDFDRIARVLLNKVELVTKENVYRIREIEFYYYSPNHNDFYCHKHERQRTCNRLYFHRFKSPASYDKLKFKGLDITNGNDNSYGGILIRAIENTKSNEILTGI